MKLLLIDGDQYVEASAEVSRHEILAAQADPAKAVALVAKLEVPLRKPERPIIIAAPKAAPTRRRGRK